jgi:hypothetical protein
MTAVDFTLDGNSDLLIESGDFVLSHSDGMHMEHIIYSNLGYWRNAPLVGVGIEYYLNASVGTADVKREIKIQLEADGYQVQSIDVAFKPTLTVAIDAARIR